MPEIRCVKETADLVRINPIQARAFAAPNSR